MFVIMQKTPDFQPEFRASLPKTDHVLSHDFPMTVTFGHLNPVFHTIVSPGDTVKLGFDFNLRTMPMEAAAFGDFVCHTEFFFVPMQLLYQGFDSSFYGITDLFSSQMVLNPRQDLPLLDFDLVVQDLYNNRAVPADWYPESTDPIESIGQSSIRLFDLLGYNPTGIACQDPGGGNFYNPNVFPYPILAYNCIYQYIYRLDARERFKQSTFNVDSQYAASGAGYFLPRECFLMKYRPLDNDYFTDISVSPIVDVLNLSTKTNLTTVNSWLTRKTARSSGLYDMPVIGSGRVGFDSNVLGSPNYENYSNPQNDIQTQFGFNSQIGDTVVGNLVYSGFPNGSDINTANIRALFANEKLWSITGRAKKNYDDQTLAHFGFKVPHDVKHQVTKFGHDVTTFHIGEVISTSATAQAPLGEIAGKGYASQSGQVHTLTAPCHGVVMAIFSVTLQHNYEAGILKANMVVNGNDLYKPEYDHLGKQPLFAYETKYFNALDVNAGNVLGWQYRYEQWKRRYNRCTGAFKNAYGSLKSWFPTFIPYGGPDSNSGKSGNAPDTDSYLYFLNYPQDGNQLFLGQYQSTWSTVYEDKDNWAAMYDFDPLVVNSRVNCVLVSSMSDYSLPRLDA